LLTGRNLFLNDGLQAFRGRLDCAFVDIRAYPAAAQFLGNGSGRAAADEAVKDKATWERE